MNASRTRTSGDFAGSARAASPSSRRASASAALGGDVDRAVDVLGEVRPVAEMAPAAHHRQVDAGAAAVDLDGEDVGVDGAAAGVVLDRLLVQHARERADPVR